LVRERDVAAPLREGAPELGRKDDAALGIHGVLVLPDEPGHQNSPPAPSGAAGPSLSRHWPPPYAPIPHRSTTGGAKTSLIPGPGPPAGGYVRKARGRGSDDHATLGGWPRSTWSCSTSEASWPTSAGSQR